jgi:hypothetical protein
MHRFRMELKRMADVPTLDGPDLAYRSTHAQIKDLDHILCEVAREGRLRWNDPPLTWLASGGSRV